jgi:hypothetical protein
MSKEAYLGQDCACGQRIQFMEYHWPHCPANPANLAKTQEGRGVLSRVEARGFTKSDLATIATHGPMRDQPVRKMHGVGSRKPKGGKKR